MIRTQEKIESGTVFTLHSSKQQSATDTNALLGLDPDKIILNSGRTETEAGPRDEPLTEIAFLINHVNYLFPAMVAIESANRERNHTLDMVDIGSIAFGIPSCFGPVYHSSKIAADDFVSGVGPTPNKANPRMRLWLYQPQVIKGTLSWVPVNRLNEAG